MEKEYQPAEINEIQAIKEKVKRFGNSITRGKKLKSYLRTQTSSFIKELSQIAETMNDFDFGEKIKATVDFLQLEPKPNETLFWEAFNATPSQFKL